jgi:hypothetical protein
MTSEVESVLDLSEFGIAVHYESIVVPLDQIQDGDLIGEATGESELPMNTLVGKLVTSFAVSPEGKIAIAIFTTATSQEDIYLYDPQLHTLEYLAQGRRPRWFYFQHHL